MVHTHRTKKDICRTATDTRRKTGKERQKTHTYIGLKANTHRTHKGSYVTLTLIRPLTVCKSKSFPRQLLYRYRAPSCLNYLYITFIVSLFS